MYNTVSFRHHLTYLSLSLLSQLRALVGATHKEVSIAALFGRLTA